MYPSPLDVGFADDLLQVVLRCQDRWDVRRKRGEWFGVVAFDQAFPEVPQQHASQRASRVVQVAAQIVLDGEFCLALAADRRTALHEVAARDLPERVGDRELAVLA